MDDVYKTTDRANRFNENGEEVLNPTPLQPPVGYRAQPSLIETIRAQVRAHHYATLDMEPETEEEADDFDIPDDPADPQSRWENDMIPSIKETRARIKELEAQERLYASPRVKPQTGGAEAPPSTPTNAVLDEQ